MMPFEVPVEKLRRTVDPDLLSCKTTEEVSGSHEIIGQERATHSLLFGLGIKAYGFNIFVSGIPGTGRTTAVKRFLENEASSRPVPPDWCYVRDFHNNSRPNAIRMPPGRAKEFQADMKSLIDSVQSQLKKIFESEDYAAQRKQAAAAFQQQAQEILERVNNKAQEEGFSLQQSPMGIMTVPVKDGKPMTQEEFAALTAEEREALGKRQQDLQEEIEAAVRQARGVERSASAEVERMDQQVALYALNQMMVDLKTKYRDIPEALDYLDHVQADILENLDQFRSETPKSSEDGGSQNMALATMMAGAREQFFRRYGVNLLVDNSGLNGAPVVIELNPTYINLFGRIENEAQFGTLVTDFNLIKKGSLHSANGGFLVIPVEELLRNPLSWDSLKRALKNQVITIEDPTERMGLLTTRTLQPEPIPLDAKIILIGQPSTYQVLQAYDEDFDELFKVKADFDTSMPLNHESEDGYIAFVGNLCRSEGLKHVDCTGLARIIEYGARLAEDQQKLSTRFSEIADILREANYYANIESSPYVSEAQVQKAIEEKVYRSNLMQEKIQEMTRRGILMIDVDGERVGQVNGLSVLSLGDISFGQPNRITASIGVGREGLVNIEREAQLSGPLHTKGVLILAGYLLDKFAQDKPMALGARITFEQNYSGVEGDSASSTELYALLSALSGCPIHQGIAVTGSVNQKGEIQPIGGVNEKVEGFYEVCKARGLTGKQGVLVPRTNLDNLMLKQEIVDAVREGKFHLWSVSTVDEGIEVLTGIPGGQRQENGKFAEGTINARVDQKLRQLAETLANFGKEMKEEVRGQ